MQIEQVTTLSLSREELETITRVLMYAAQMGDAGAQRLVAQMNGQQPAVPFVTGMTVVPNVGPTPEQRALMEREAQRIQASTANVMPAAHEGADS